MLKDAERSEKSQSEQDHDAMLREALSRPGVREAMEVYQGWRRVDRGLDPYRAAMRQWPRVTTTAHTTRR